VIEELAERTRLACAASFKQVQSAQLHPKLQEAQNSRLSTIHRIESLIQEKTNGPRPVYPNWAILVHVRRVVKHSRDVGNHEAKARERDLKYAVSKPSLQEEKKKKKSYPQQGILTAFGAIDIGKMLITWLHQYGLST